MKTKGVNNNNNGGLVPATLLLSLVRLHMSVKCLFTLLREPYYYPPTFVRGH